MSRRSPERINSLTQILEKGLKLHPKFLEHLEKMPSSSKLEIQKEVTTKEAMHHQETTKPLFNKDQ